MGSRGVDVETRPGVEALRDGKSGPAGAAGPAELERLEADDWPLRPRGARGGDNTQHVVLELDHELPVELDAVQPPAPRVEPEAETALLKRNRELEDETEILRARAVDLRAELDALRFAGVLDLEKENGLLRLEVKRHKRFIERVVAEAQHPSMSRMAPEERYRLVLSGLESGKYHLLGLAYASAADPTWRTSITRFPSWTCPRSGRILEMCSTKYEYRPVGVPRCQATIINTRYEWSLELPLDEYFRQRGSFASGTFKTENGVKVRTDLTPPEFAEIAAQLGGDEGIHIYNQRETIEESGISFESNFAAMQSTVEVCVPAVFPELSARANLPDGFMARARVRCSSNLRIAGGACAAALHDTDEAPSSSHRMYGLLGLEDPMDPSRSWFVNINSVPVEEEMFGLHIHEAFSACDELHPLGRAELQRLFNSILSKFSAVPLSAPAKSAFASSDSP